ncbi:hypothetical protein BJ170DRAFT_397576 [Xylariales sp. AK1849]|nr:hypothetical protein BJ170DRAFT_397576 [Xylariales sp. AK1849]
MDPQVGRKTSRALASRALRAKAPVAARFEDCLQAFGRLCTALRANLPASEHVDSLADDCMFRLISWGHDSGASNRMLDHKLRRSSRPRDNTLDLLKELDVIVTDAIEVIPNVFNSIDEKSQTDNDSADVPEDVGIFDDLESESDPEKYLEDAAEVVGCLVDLLPTLCHPVEDDEYQDRRGDNASLDTEVIRKLFPGAPGFLIERLAVASWQRRWNVRLSKRTTGGAIIQYEEDSDIEASPRLPKSYSQSLMHGAPSSHRFRHLSTQTESEFGTSTIGSTVASSVFSKKGAFDLKSTTSAGTAYTSTRIFPLPPPEPPVDLRSESLDPFPCPYCHFEVPFGNGGMTGEDWIEHVYLDLEPYICTFEECSRAQKTFGIKQEWSQHEHDCHRARLVWFCSDSLCKQEFDNKESFDTHLRAQHRDLFSSTEPSGVDEACVRYSTRPVSRELCPLCGIRCSDVASMNKHIGNHLEQIGLWALLDDDSSDDEVLEGRDSPAPGNTKPGFILEEFVEEQAGKLATEDASLFVPEQTNISGKSIFQQNSQGDSETNGTSGFVDDAPKNPRRAKEDWTNKVQTFLNKQPQGDQYAGSHSMDSTPTIWSNRPRRDKEFVGREQDLDHIHKVLSGAGQICVLSGRGGIGKTSTANEYSYCYENEFSHIFWVEAETSGGCADKYNLIGSVLAAGGDKVHEQSSLTIRVREELTKMTTRWLLVFDNVEEWADISRYIPRNLSKTRGSVLATTRQDPLLKTHARNYHSIALDTLTLEESSQFLLCSIDSKLKRHQVRSHRDYKLAIQAARLVGRLPLAMSMIAGYVKVSRATLDEFLETWEEKEFRSKETDRAMQYDGLDSSIDLLWDIGIAELSLNARRLLEIMSFLDPETIQKDLLVGEHKETFLEFLNASETIRYRRMISQLSGRKLIRVRQREDGKETYNIHRLLQEKILLDVGGLDKFSDIFGKAYCLVRRRYPRASPIQAPEPKKWTECKEYMPHVFSLHRALKATTQIEPTLELAQLFYDAGFHVWERQASEYDALSFLETAENILDAISFDSNAKIRADINCIAGLTYSSMGCTERTESLKRLETALRIRQTIFDANTNDRTSDVLLRNAATDYGISLLNDNAFDRAGEIFAECRERYLTWGTEEEIPFEYSKYYKNTGMVLMWQGKMSEATKSIERSVELIEKASGQAWQYWGYQFIRACVLLQAGDVQGALELHLKTLSARLDLSGKHSQSTILSTYAVGAMYHHIGDLPTAIDYMKQCIECTKESKWTEEALARAQFHLSTLYGEHGIEAGEARQLEDEARKVSNKYSSFVSECLQDADDLMLVFDEFQPTFDGRFTGQRLLKQMQEWYSQDHVKIEDSTVECNM